LWPVVSKIAYVSAPALRVIEQVARPAPDPEGWSAKSLAVALDMPLSTVAYHLRMLRDRELIVQSGERRAARGALYETFYRLVTP
jgi:DNA-binding IclR family transcriptional regulator